MEVKIGDRISIEAERVGTPEREGEVLEIVEGTTTITYRIRWTDGRVSLFTPSAGSVRVLPMQKPKPKPKPKR